MRYTQPQSGIRLNSSFGLSVVSLGSNLLDLKSNKDFVSVNNPTPAINKYGKCMRFAKVASQRLYEFNPMTIQGKYSFIAVVDSRGSDWPYSSILNVFSNPEFSYAFQLRHTGVYWDFYHKGGNGADLLAQAPYSPGPQVVIGTWDGAGLHLYINGHLAAWTYVTDVLTSSVARVSIGADIVDGNVPVSGSYWEGDVNLVGISVSTCWTAAQVKSLHDNPWQIFADNKKPIFIGVGAAPSGLSITAELATASTSGYAATVNLQSVIHTTLATATASGFTASVGTGNAITATLATATASGQTATVNRQSNITATQAVASASGQIATVNRQLAIAATLATATASGQLATVNLQRSVVSTQAVATATGYAASVQLGNDLSISATQAIATASGLDAVINRQLSIASSVAVATASGFDESISNGASIAASYGLASADGYQAQINLQREVAASLATASASGFTSAISTSTGSAYWPTPDQVLSGTPYGPTGADYTGTATGGAATTIVDAITFVINDQIMMEINT